jgi:hypothetical protein
MRKIISIAAVLSAAFFFVTPARAQYTTVTATVHDPNGIPYANGLMSAVLVPASPGRWTLNGPPYLGQIGLTNLDTTGTFSATFGDNNVILPGGSQWLITIFSNPGGIPLPLGTGQQSFTVTMTITGGSQNISTTLNAAATKLTNFAGNGSGTIGGGIAANQVAVGSGTNAITGSNNFTFLSNTLSLINTAGANSLNIANTTVSTAPANQSSPTSCIAGTFWNGAASAVDSYCIQNSIPNGTNPQSTLNFVHSGSSSPSNYAFDGQAAFVGAVSAAGLSVASGGINILNAGVLTFVGATSGTAAIGIAAVAGTPCKLILPTVSPSAGQFLSAAAPSGGNCLASWANGTGGSGTLTASGLSLPVNQIMLGNSYPDAKPLGSLGTTTTLLHGNAGGAPTFGSVVSADLNITGTTCTNQVVSAISSAAAGTCHTIVGADMASNTVTATQLAAQYGKWLACDGKGLGDGLNAIAAGTYLESTCKNISGVTVTITGVQCFSDNNGTSTLNAAGNTLGALLTGAITCTTSYAAGTQSANVALTSNDYIKFTFVADGTSKQTDWVVTGTY